MEKTPVTDSESAIRPMGDISRELGDRSELLDASVLSNRRDYRASCNVYIGFYEIILRKDVAVAVSAT